MSIHELKQTERTLREESFRLEQQANETKQDILNWNRKYIDKAEQAIVEVVKEQVHELSARGIHIDSIEIEILQHFTSRKGRREPDGTFIHKCYIKDAYEDK